MTQDSKTEALNLIVPKSSSVVLCMTHQQHILLAYGTYSDRNVRPVINTPKFVGVTEMLQGSSFPVSVGRSVIRSQYQHCCSGQDEFHHNA